MTNETTKAKVTDDSPPETTQEQEPKKKRRKYRTRKKTPQFESKELIKQIFEIVGKRNEIWKLSDNEITNLSGSVDAVVIKYIDLGNYAEEIALAVIAGSIFIPRAYVQFKISSTGKKKVETETEKDKS